MPRSKSSRHDALLDGLKRPRRRAAALDVWMSHGDRVTAAPPGFTVTARTDRVPDRRDGRRGRSAGTACSSIPKSRTPAGRRRCCAASWSTSAAARRCGPPANIIEDQIARVRAQVGDDEVHPRPVRRRRFLGGRRAAAQGHRRAADLRVRRHRPAALAGRRPGDGDVRRAHGRQGDPRRCRRPLLQRAAKASPTRKPSARSSATCSSRSSTRSPRKLHNAKWLAQGTIYPGRDRVGRQQDRQGARHQEPPQRRRPARAHEAGPGRAAARAVQGRSAPPRRRTRPAARRWSTAIRSRARAWACASSAR